MHEKHHGQTSLPEGRQGLADGHASELQVPQEEVNSQTAAAAPVNKFLQKLNARRAKRTKVLPKPADQSNIVSAFLLLVYRINWWERMYSG